MLQEVWKYLSSKDQSENKRKDQNLIQTLIFSFSNFAVMIMNQKSLQQKISSRASQQNLSQISQRSNKQSESSQPDADVTVTTEEIDIKCDSDSEL